jgi:hypothetical protein
VIFNKKKNIILFIPQQNEAVLAVTAEEITQRKKFFSNMKGIKTSFNCVINS